MVEDLQSYIRVGWKIVVDTPDAMCEGGFLGRTLLNDLVIKKALYKGTQTGFHR